MLDEYGHIEVVLRHGDMLASIISAFHEDEAGEPPIHTGADGSFLVASLMQVDDFCRELGISGGALRDETTSCCGENLS